LELPQAIMRDYIPGLWISRRDGFSTWRHPKMAVDNSVSNTTSGPVSETITPGNMVHIDTPRGKLTGPQQAARLRLVEEDLARLQDQLMDVLEENQQLRTELEAWRTGARTLVQQAS
ncbi:MAG TPA: hypothetical protein VGD64_14250, partial [Acidisarcina sp.]